MRKVRILSLQKTTFINRLYDLFVGNKQTQIIFRENWERLYHPITNNLIRRHLKHEIAIGSYSIYRSNGDIYSKWICIDIDSHKRIDPLIRKEIRRDYEADMAKRILKKLEKKYKKLIDLDVKKRQLEMIEELFKINETGGYFGIPNEYIVLEDSGGGYHLWIFLKDKTLLSDVGKWVYHARPRLNLTYCEFFLNGGYPEIYPKQYSIEHLNKGVGNGVRLPLGYNFSKKWSSEILKGDLRTVEKFDLHKLVENWSEPEPDYIEKGAKRMEVVVFEAQEVPITLDFYMELPIRTCFKRIINGMTQCEDDHGHLIRMALVHELRYYKVPMDIMIDCFKCQDDFDPVESNTQINSVINSSRLKDGRYSCLKIKQLGYCHDCNKT